MMTRVYLEAHFDDHERAAQLLAQLLATIAADAPDAVVDYEMTGQARPPAPVAPAESAETT